MSSQPQPQPRQVETSFPGFARVFHVLDALKAHLVSLQQGLELARQLQLQPQQPDQQPQSQPETHAQVYSPGPPPAYSTPLSSSDSTLTPRVLPNPHQHQPHPHVYGHGYIQSQSQPQLQPLPATPTGGPGSQDQQHHQRHQQHRQQQDQEQLHAQIQLGRACIGPATAELNRAIVALRRREVEVEREVDVETGKRRDTEEKMAELERKLNQSEWLGCVVM